MDMETMSYADSAILMKKPNPRQAWKRNVLSFGEKSNIKINCKFNNIRNINQTLKECNGQLPFGGALYGFFEPVTKREERIKKDKSSLQTRMALYYDIIIRRILPRIPPFKKWNEKYTLVRNRSISKCEMFGRLIYTGFRIENIHENRQYIHFTAVKVREPGNGVSHQSGLFIRLPRVGKDGKVIHIYKLRTMYPYAHYLHGYLIEQSGFDNQGKINNDYRISEWGWFLRRFWLDELPQLVNLIKCQFRLVGVRPISEALFNKYPQDLRELRIKNKPGIIPPFYADLPNSMEEVYESERRYLLRFQVNPVRTDVEYLCKALYNIIVKRVRSK
jgi:lipopolysaccharide/colanic/teichoic acid biosynthesis glycosyltransferase